MSDQPKRHSGAREKPVSLHPLTPEQALGKLLKAKPAHKPQQGQEAQKPASKKRGESK